MRNKLLIVMIFCLLTVSLCGCDIPKWVGEVKPQPNEQQLQCEHEWVEIAWHAQIASDGSGVTYDIYCPKCQWEETVSYKEWNRIQADMNYKNNQ